MKEALIIVALTLKIGEKTSIVKYQITTPLPDNAEFVEGEGLIQVVYMQMGDSK